jgi:hypothetical protein
MYGFVHFSLYFTSFGILQVGFDQHYLNEEFTNYTDLFKESAAPPIETTFKANLEKMVPKETKIKASH